MAWQPTIVTMNFTTVEMLKVLYVLQFSGHLLCISSQAHPLITKLVSDGSDKPTTKEKNIVVDTEKAHLQIQFSNITTA